MNALNLEIRWHRPDAYKVPILLQKTPVKPDQALDKQYSGRVSLVGALEKGDVSMRLENITLADRGDYVCYAKSTQWYESATVNLQVRVVGSALAVSVGETTEGQVNITCATDGWSPQPNVTWTNRQGSLPGSPTMHSEGSGGMTALFVITLLLLLALLIGMFVAYRKEGQSLASPVDDKVVTNDETQPANGINTEGLPTLSIEKIPPEMKDVETNTEVMMKDMIIVTPEWDSLKSYAVEKICLEVKGIPEFLKVKDGPGVKTEVWCPDPARVQGHAERDPHVLCQQRFNSGKHCWGVKMWTTPKITEMATNDKKIKQKQSWYVGVCRDGEEKIKKVRLTPENGFWVLQYEKGTGLFVNTDPPTPVPMTELFRRLGVFLDCDKHTLSFYNIDTNSHLCTFENVGGMSGGAIHPLVSPGIRDSEVMRVCTYEEMKKKDILKV
ncbi:butyrophilin subfamily 3 member A3-like [Engraulis encrasicolus]|uniref:butyrophilin subfamily 3 member A3-like n=1 Tax=Engraulis encrasicolus TaxID=184585 RepID=UPI002FCF4B71